MLATFTLVLHVPNLSTVEKFLAALNEPDAFTQQQIAILARKIGSRRLDIGIKKLLSMIDMANKLCEEEQRVDNFVCRLEEYLKVD